MCKLGPWPGDPSNSSTQIGWTAGAGVEFAFTPNLTAKVEYLYVDLGNHVLRPLQLHSANGTCLPLSHFTENVVRAGINYKFW